MKKFISIILSFVLCLSVGSVFASCYQPSTIYDEVHKDLDDTLANIKAVVDEKIDATGDNEVKAEDARQILLASAKLPCAEKAKTADIDGDGIVTALDARLALRYSAGLVSTKQIYFNSADDAAKLDFFNKIMATIKPTNYNVRPAISSTTKSITLTNEKALNQLSDEMNKLMKDAKDSEKVNLAREFYSQVGLITYNNPSTFTVTPGAKYPIYDSSLGATGCNAFSSLLTLDDITSITYETNQSVSYVRRQYNRTNGSIDRTQPPYEIQHLDLEGLDKITIHVKDDPKMAMVPSPMTSLHSGKVMPIPSQKELQDSTGELSTQINSIKKEMDDLFKEIGSLSKLVVTRSDISCDAKFLDVAFNNSDVTLYLDPATGKPVLTNYSIDYNYNTNFAIEMYISIPMQVIYLKFPKQTIGVNQTENKVETYLFTQNYAPFLKK